MTTAKTKKTNPNVVYDLRVVQLTLGPAPKGSEPAPPTRTAADVASIMATQTKILDAPREEFWALYMNAKHRVHAIHRVSIGTLSSSLVHPREIFMPAVHMGSAAVIVVHNHPSGDPEPSPEDIEVTSRLRKAGDILGIPLMDHVIVTPQRYVSIRETTGW